MQPTPAARAAFHQCMRAVATLRDSMVELIQHDPSQAAATFGTAMMNLAHPIDGPFHTGLNQLADHIQPCGRDGCTCHIHCANILRSFSQHVMPHVTSLSNHAEAAFTHPLPPTPPSTGHDLAQFIQDLTGAPPLGGTGCQPVGATGSLPVPISGPHCRVKVERPGFPAPMWLSAFSQAPGDGTPGLLAFTNKEDQAAAVPKKHAEDIILPLLRKSCPRVELIPC